MHTQISGCINKRLVAGMEASEITDVAKAQTSQDNRLVIMVKDPTTLFAYWEVDTLHKRIVCEHFHTEWVQLQLLLQVYDVTDILFDGGNSHFTRRIHVRPDIADWYITELPPGRRYLADFGTLTEKGQFFPILRSNVVGTPPLTDRSRLEPSVRFAAAESTVSHQMMRVRADTQETLAADVRLLRPYQTGETWRHQFDGYHLAGLKGGDA